MDQRLSTAEGWMKTWGDCAGTDAAHDQATAEYLALLHRGGWTNGNEGWWQDWSAYLSPWGVGLAAVGAPVRLWHGLAPLPPAHSRWLARRIPQITARFPEEEDHTTSRATTVPLHTSGCVMRSSPGIQEGIHERPGDSSAQHAAAGWCLARGACARSAHLAVGGGWLGRPGCHLRCRSWRTRIAGLGGSHSDHRGALASSPTTVRESARATPLRR